MGVATNWLKYTPSRRHDWTVAQDDKSKLKRQLVMVQYMEQSKQRVSTSPDHPISPWVSHPSQ